MNPAELAKYTADRARRRHEIRRNRSDAAAETQEQSSATYTGYDADSGLHLTSAGNADLMLGNVGLDAGQRINFSGGHIDASPRVKAKKRSDFIAGGEEAVWAIAFSRRYFKDLVPFLGNRRSTKVWFVSSAFREPQLLLEIPEFEVVIGSEFSVTNAPKVYLFMAMDESGTIFLDAKIETYYVQDIFEGEVSGGYYQFVNQNLSLMHWRIQGTTISTITESGGWKAPFTNSPTNTPLSAPSEYPSCQGWAWGDRMQYVTFQYTQSIGGGVAVPVGPFQHQYIPGEYSHNLLASQNTMYVVPKPNGMLELASLTSVGQISAFQYKISDSYCETPFSGFNIGAHDTSVLASFPPIDIDTPTRNTEHPLSNEISTILSQSLIDSALIVLPR